MDDEEVYVTIDLTQVEHHGIVLALADQATFFSNALMHNSHNLSTEVIDQTKEMVTMFLELMEKLDQHGDGILKAWNEGREAALEDALKAAEVQNNNLANVIDIETKREEHNDSNTKQEEPDVPRPEGESDSDS